eukprot:COSAG06_NODE_2303_length_7118_cov_4.980339_3_plen_116_part_00
MSTYTIPSSQIKRPADLCVPILHGLLVSSVPFFLRLLGSSDRLLVTSAVVCRAGVVFGYYFSTFQILRFCNAFRLIVANEQVEYVKARCQTVLCGLVSLALFVLFYYGPYRDGPK